MRRMLRLLALTIVSAAASIVLIGGGGVSAIAFAAEGDVDDFSYESMDADYTLGRADDGTSTLTVVETYVAIFPEFDQNHGMRRSIPDTYKDQPLFPEFVSITDENGDARPAEVEQDDGEFTMTSRADEFVHGRQTYVFTYTLQNVTWFFSDSNADEFYWDVNGLDTRQPIGRVTARVHVPAELSGTLTGMQACYVGEEGSTQTCDIEPTAADGDGMLIEASASDVARFHTVTISVGFKGGTFTAFDSSYFASPWGWLQGVAGIGVIGSIGIAAAARRRTLRDEPGRPTIIAEYSPPPGMDALESAMLLGRPDKAIPAEVLEQAVVGSIRILEGPKGMFGRAVLQAQLIDPSRADGDGRLLLDGLFPSGQPGSLFEFGQYNKRFSTAAQGIAKAANAGLAARGLLRPVPVRVRVIPVAIAAVTAALVVILGLFAIRAGVIPLVPVLMLMAATVGLFVVVGMMVRKPLTAAGAEARDHLKGLQLFIEWAEADRIRMLQSPSGAERVQIDPSDPRQMLKLYESLLPYAVVFGQEKEWAQRLIDLNGGESPTWYSGTSGFNAAAFSASIGSLSSSASSSSSTGGSSGGGSAGGGGGGGGSGGV